MRYEEYAPPEVVDLDWGAELGCGCGCGCAGGAGGGGGAGSM